MFEGLKLASQKNHYLDVSEAVRSIVRKKWLKQKDPELYKIEKLRTEVTELVQKQSEEKNRQLIIKELQKIKDTLLK